MTSLTDILTTAQNIVRAISNLGTTYLQVQGSLVSNGIAAATLISTGQGRLVRITVITAGTTTGAAYDANLSTATTSPVLTIPNTVGVIDVNIPINNGIVIAPGTGQVVTVSYS
jgi:orotidine-5'-phosphate decarboxylase